MRSSYGHPESQSAARGPGGTSPVRNAGLAPYERPDTKLGARVRSHHHRHTPGAQRHGCCAVVRIGRLHTPGDTCWHDEQSCVEVAPTTMLAHVDARIMGVILNAADFTEPDLYYYGNRYGSYYHDSAPR